MESRRQSKVSRLLQKELGTLFVSDLKSLTGKSIVSVTVVRISPDLGYARVYLSIFSPGGETGVLENIQDHTSEVRGKLGNKVRNSLKKVPELQFFEDDSLDYSERINELLGP